MGPHVQGVEQQGRKGPGGGGFTATGKGEEGHFGLYFLLTRRADDRLCVTVGSRSPF